MRLLLCHPRKSAVVHRTTRRIGGHCCTAARIIVRGVVVMEDMQVGHWSTIVPLRLRLRRLAKPLL